MTVSPLFWFPARWCASAWRDPEPTILKRSAKGKKRPQVPYFLFFICICQKSCRNKRKHGEEMPSAPALGHLRFVCLQSDFASLRSVSVLCLWYLDASPCRYAQQFPRSLITEQLVSLRGCLFSSFRRRMRSSRRAQIVHVNSAT